MNKKILGEAGPFIKLVCIKDTLATDQSEASKVQDKLASIQQKHVDLVSKVLKGWNAVNKIRQIKFDACRDRER